MLVASLMAVVTVAWHQLPNELDAATDVSLLGRAQRANQNADMLHDTLRADVLSALLLGQLPGLQPADVLRSLRENATEFRGELTAVVAMPLPAALRPQITGTRAAGLTYVEHTEQIVALALSDRRAALARMTEFSASFEAARQALALQTEALAQALELRHRQAREGAERARRWLMIAAALTVIGGWVCVTLIGRSVRRSLTALSDVAHDVAAGQLDRRSDQHSGDEVGHLAESINHMAGNLQHTIDRMRSDAELTEAMDMADSEPQAFEVVAQAMSHVSSQHAMELLIADSSDAHLARAATHPSAGPCGCTVESPFGCIAVRRGHAVSFADSGAMNACPKLRHRPGEAISAVCVPVTFMGRALGVLHATGPVDQALSAEQQARLASLGTQAGARIGTVRAFERSQFHASTDVLTGLPNRRSTEQRLRELAQGHRPFALVMADLDRFKHLNDTYGHQAGDDALRVFADTVRAHTREHDLCGR